MFEATPSLRLRLSWDNLESRRVQRCKESSCRVLEGDGSRIATPVSGCCFMSLDCVLGGFLHKLRFALAFGARLVANCDGHGVSIVSCGIAETRCSAHYPSRLQNRRLPPVSLWWARTRKVDKSRALRTWVYHTQT